MVFFGCAFIAFGPAFALFSLTVAKDAQQVIVLIARWVGCFLITICSCLYTYSVDFLGNLFKVQ